MKIVNKKNLLTVSLVILLLLPSILPLLREGFFITDDGEWMIIRLSAFYQAIADGQFPARFLGRLNFGYGYPVATFLYPGFMYMGIFIHLLKISLADTIKIILGVSMVTSFAFSYFWLRKFFGKTQSLVGCLFYVYTPYYIYDIYVRGSAGEVLALAVLPFILWQSERKSTFWVGVGVGALILSHNSLAVLFLVLIISYVLLNLYISKNKLTFLNSITAIFLGFGISAFFWIPVITELQNTVFSRTVVSEWSGYFAKVSLIGYSTIFLLLLTIANFVSRKIVIKEHRLTVFFICVCSISIFFALPASSFLWNSLPVGFIQFPFRFLSVIPVCAAFLAASNLNAVKGKLRIFQMLFLAGILILSALPFFQKIQYTNKDEGFYGTNEATTTVQDEFMPVWVKNKPTKRFDRKVEILKGEGETKNVIYDNKKIAFSTDLKNSSIIQVNTIYWPGWKASIDKKPVEITYTNPKGVMELSVPKGNHSVELEFSETPIRFLGDIISIISFVLLVYFSSKFRMKKTN